MKVGTFNVHSPINNKWPGQMVQHYPTFVPGQIPRSSKYSSMQQKKTKKKSLDATIFDFNFFVSHQL